MKKCSYCGRESPDGQAHCQECGTFFASSAPQEGMLNPRAIHRHLRKADVGRILMGLLWLAVGALVLANLGTRIMDLKDCLPPTVFRLLFLIPMVIGIYQIILGLMGNKNKQT